MPPDQISGKKKEPKPKLFGPDSSRQGGGLPREGVGAEKFGMSLGARSTKLFWREIPGFCRDIPEVPEKFEKKKFVFNFRSLRLGRKHLHIQNFLAKVIHHNSGEILWDAYSAQLNSLGNTHAWLRF